MYPNKIGSVTLLSHNLSKIAQRSGFKLRDMENRGVDWKAIGNIDINKLLDMQDYDLLLKLVPTLIEAPMLSVLNASVLDPSVSAVFRLSQLGLQYLSFCLQFMDHTLYELRTTMHQLQKHNTTLIQNYKNLEEEHYKTKEQLQNVLAVDKIGVNDGQTERFACTSCTKNFRSNESLTAHVIRKHSKKVEAPSEDDVEKGACSSPEMKNKSRQKLVAGKHGNGGGKIENKEENHIVEDGEEMHVNRCTECTKRKVSTAVSIQCNIEDLQGSKNLIVIANDTDDKEEATKPPDHIQNETTNDELPIQTDPLPIGATKPSEDEKTDNYDGLVALMRQEMQTIINQFQSKMQDKFATAEMEGREENAIHQTERALEQTNDKIDSIQQRFVQFQDDFYRSRLELTETFKDWDERQKFYIEHVNEMIKNVHNQKTKTVDAPILEKSLEDELTTNIRETEEDAKSNDSKLNGKRDLENRQLDQTAAHGNDELSSETDYTSSEESLHDEHDGTQRSSDSACSQNEDEIIKSAKEQANEYLNQELKKFGIQNDSTGISTPAYIEITKAIKLNRSKTEKANLTFTTIRDKLEKDLLSIVKNKLKTSGSASLENVTKSKSVKEQTDERILAKLISNDIDEEDIKNKISRAQSVLEAHRESIKTLLNTTAHTPTTIVPQSSKQPKTIVKPNDNRTTRPHVRLPNNNTRRVVFVNLDEDS